MQAVPRKKILIKSLPRYSLTILRAVRMHGCRWGRGVPRLYPYLKNSIVAMEAALNFACSSSCWQRPYSSYAAFLFTAKGLDSNPPACRMPCLAYISPLGLAVQPCAFSWAPNMKIEYRSAAIPAFTKKIPKQTGKQRSDFHLFLEGILQKAHSCSCHWWTWPTSDLSFSGPFTSNLPIHKE